ncbi:hypothetical protein LJR011_000198 [Agrobacterium tumefaciens]
MAAYRFYAPADAAQDKIWRDTVDTWREAQAEAYLRGLHAHCTASATAICFGGVFPKGLPFPVTSSVRLISAGISIIACFSESLITATWA